MEKLSKPPRPSRVTIPHRCHPAAAVVFAEMRRQNVTYEDLEHRSGVLRSTFKAWRTNNRPSLESLEAALGVLGWTFICVPGPEVLPAAVQAQLAVLAEEYGLDDEGLLAHYVREIAHLPLATIDARTRRELSRVVPANDCERAEAAA